MSTLQKKNAYIYQYIQVYIHNDKNRSRPHIGRHIDTDYLNTRCCYIHSLHLQIT